MYNFVVLSSSKYLKNFPSFIVGWLIYIILKFLSLALSSISCNITNLIKMDYLMMHLSNHHHFNTHFYTKCVYQKTINFNKLEIQRYRYYNVILVNGGKWYTREYSAWLWSTTELWTQAASKWCTYINTYTYVWLYTSFDEVLLRSTD